MLELKESRNLIDIICTCIDTIHKICCCKTLIAIRQYFEVFFLIIVACDVLFSGKVKCINVVAV